MNDTMATTSGSAVSRYNFQIGVFSTVALMLVARHAYAYEPNEELRKAVAFRIDYMRDYEPELWRDNFSIPENGPDGIEGPDGTPDGIGAFQYFHGENGEVGAIYASPGGSEAMYGAILASWAAAGHEAGFGYPGSPEQDAGSGSLEDGCQPGDRIQWFRRYTDHAAFIACYSWERNFTSWIRVAR